jgi:hypothetical protein
VAASGRLLRSLFVPSLPDVFFCALWLAAFAQPAGLRALLADGDTGWHIRTGELVLTTGHTPLVDPFSFSRAGAPWFAWEWLSDVLFARLYLWHGTGTVAAMAGVVLALAATFLFVRLLRRGSGLWIALAVSLAAVSASTIHYLARPHIFSILFYTLALWILDEDRRQPRRWLWLLPPLAALWANLHAGFVAWLVTAAILPVIAALRHEWPAARRYGTLAALSFAATLANPYGWGLHLHIARYLSSAWIMEHVQEFQSPNIRSEGMIVFAVLLLAAAAVAARANAFEATLVLLWGFAALRSARHVPMFAIVAAPVVAGAWATAWQRLAARAGARHPLRILWELAQDLGRRPRLSLCLPVAAVGAVLAAPAVGFPEAMFPVQAVERNVAQLAPGTAMPRILAPDQWADYLIFRLYPRQRVFFDGRSDFFGPALCTDYHKLLTGERSWRQLLDRYAFELALLPHDWPLGAALEREPGWRCVYRDEVAALYAREGSGKR